MDQYFLINYGSLPEKGTKKPKKHYKRPKNNSFVNIMKNPRQILTFSWWSHDWKADHAANYWGLTPTNPPKHTLTYASVI